MELHFKYSIIFNFVPIWKESDLKYLIAHSKILRQNQEPSLALKV